MRLIFLITLLLSTNFLSAQLTDVAFVGNYCKGMALQGNNLFAIGNNRIYTINITDTLPTSPILFLDGLDNPYSLSLNDNDLYISEYTINKILKVNHTDQPPTPITITNTISGPTETLLIGNELYISEHLGNKISKINITDSISAPSDVVLGLNGPTGLCLKGNILYISEYLGNKISKIDITSNSPIITNVVTGLNNPSGLALHGNYLYVSETGAGKISKIDVTEPTPSPIDVVTGLNDPFTLIINDLDIYIVEYSGGKVSKFTDHLLSTHTIVDNRNFSLFPNPSSGMITISGIGNNQNYTIFNILGERISDGTISNGESIDIRSFLNGIYFLKLETGKSIKIIKK